MGKTITNWVGEMKERNSAEVAKLTCMIFSKSGRLVRSFGEIE